MGGRSVPVHKRKGREITGTATKDREGVVQTLKKWRMWGGEKNKHLFIDLLQTISYCAGWFPCLDILRQKLVLQPYRGGSGTLDTHPADRGRIQTPSMSLSTPEILFMVSYQILSTSRPDKTQKRSSERIITTEISRTPRRNIEGKGKRKVPKWHQW